MGDELAGLLINRAMLTGGDDWLILRRGGPYPGGPLVDAKRKLLELAGGNEIQRAEPLTAFLSP